MSAEQALKTPLEEGYTNIIDPLNRIEGDLAIELTIGKQNRVTNAKCLGFVYRGFENIFKGKTPFDAMRLSTRACGVCPISHGTASTYAVELASSCRIPKNAIITRDIVLGVNYVVSHLTHFYFMWAPDLVNKRYMNYELYPEIEKRFDPLKSPHLKKILKEARIPLHKIVSLYGGKFPHPSHTIPGGVTFFPKSADIFHTLSLLKIAKAVVEEEILNGISVEEILKIESVNQILDFMKDKTFANSDLGLFIKYGQDIRLHKLGEGSPNNFLSFGFGHLEGTNWLFKPGYIEQGKFYELDTKLINEDTSSSYYETEDQWRNPVDGVTIPIPRKEGAYSWIKSPRYFGHSVEVGPLARQIVNENPLITDLVKTFGINTFTRILARFYEAIVVLDQIPNWVEELNLSHPFHYKFFESKDGQGFGLVEAPRGALGHWITIENDLVKSYQIITPTTWNCSPVDSKGEHGAVEQALIGVQLKDKDSFLEAGHIVRSFDPCISCSIHAIGKDKKSIFIEPTK